MEPLVRRAVAADLAGLLTLYAQLNPDDPKLPEARATEIWRSILGNPWLSVFVVEVGGSLAATCLLSITPGLTRGGRPFGVIENVVTDAAHRQRGFGRAVLDIAVASAWQAGCYKVMLATGSKNPATLRFYESAGFSRGKTAFQVRRP